MRAENTQYMYDSSWTDDFKHRSELDYYSPELPEMVELEETVILPAKESVMRTWGIGGVDVDELSFENIRQGIAFGGHYSYSPEEVVSLNETVYYIPVIMKHWGHFLIDVLSRFWFLLDDMDEGHRIAFCSLDFKDTSLEGNYAEVIRFLDVTPERLVLVDRPMRFRKIVVPKAAFGYSMSIHGVFLRTIARIKERALCDPQVKELTPVDKVYFTRTKFRRAKLLEVGEKDIENLFFACGYTVMSPEQLSFVEQVFYISNCKEMAALSGSIMHNVLFTEKNTRVAILNRTCMPNPPQFPINQTAEAEIVYIDCYSKWILSHPRDYGGPKAGPVWLEANENLYKYLYDSGYGKILTDSKLPTEKKLRNIMQYCYLSVRVKAKQSKLLTGIYRLARKN